MVNIADATIEDLYQVEGKAELIDGKVVEMGSTGFLPSIAAGEIYASLRDAARSARSGFPFTDNMTYEVNLPERPQVSIWIFPNPETISVDLKRRKSFSPDVSLYCGRPPTQLGDGIPDAPTLAVEVRSKNDYGKRAERAIACKIADYFAAGTAMVWDVDVLREERIVVYRAENRRNPTVYGRGESVDAEPILPGWCFPVDAMFPQSWLA